MKKLLFTLILTASAFIADACLNLYVINEQGKESIYDNYPPYEIRNKPNEDLQSLNTYAEWIKTESAEQKHRYISNYAVYLIKLGRSKEALVILRKLAGQNPKEYEILANLATAFELNGKPDSALIYMKRSLQLNPYSHKGSEWFHVRFLEATIQVRDKKIPPGEINVLKLETADVKAGEDIAHQLKERLPLSSSPNPLLSKALEETADHFKKQISIDWAMKFYAMAIGYTTDEKVIRRIWGKIDITRARIVELNRKNNKAEKKDSVRRELLKKTWREYLQKDITRWRNHRSHYQRDLSILNL